MKISAEHPDHRGIHVRTVYRRLLLDPSVGQKRCHHYIFQEYRNHHTGYLRLRRDRARHDAAAVPAGIPLRQGRAQKYRQFPGGGG